jgi:hypothetical protein
MLSILADIFDTFDSIPGAKVLPPPVSPLLYVDTLHSHRTADIPLPSQAVYLSHDDDFFTVLGKLCELFDRPSTHELPKGIRLSTVKTYLPQIVNYLGANDCQLLCYSSSSNICVFCRVTST